MTVADIELRDPERASEVSVSGERIERAVLLNQLLDEETECLLGRDAAYLKGLLILDEDVVLVPFSAAPDPVPLGQGTGSFRSEGGWTGSSSYCKGAQSAGVASFVVPGCPFCPRT